MSAVLASPATDALPLTQAQLGVLLGQQLAGDDSVFYAAEATEIDGPFDIARFEQALRSTLSEARSLHLRVRQRDGAYQQEPIAPPHAPLELVDAAGLDDAGFAAMLDDALAQPFDIDTGDLYAHRLYRRADDRHVWLHRAHHLLLDGYGFQLIARRVAAHYAALLAGVPAPVSAFGELAAVVAADVAYQASPARAEDRAFWLQTLKGLSPVSLCAQTQPGIGRGRRVGGDLPQASVDALKQLAVRLDLSWPELLIAAFAGYLARHGHGRDVVLGLPVMQRLGAASARTPCTTMNVMPLPVPEAATQSLAGLAASLRAQMPRLRPHQRYRFEHLEGDLEAAGYARGLLGTEVNVMPFESPSSFGPCRARTQVLAAGPVEDLAAIFMARGEAIDFDLDGRPQNYSVDELRGHWQGFADFLRNAVAAPSVLFRELPGQRRRAAGP